MEPSTLCIIRIRVDPWQFEEEIIPEIIEYVEDIGSFLYSPMCFRAEEEIIMYFYFPNAFQELDERDLCYEIREHLETIGVHVNEVFLCPYQKHADSLELKQHFDDIWQ